ncbi:MAG: killer suppression protein HigA [Pseudomonadota bacterium]
MLMNISFIDADIAELCKQSKVATRKLGAESAKKLQRRLSELFAASVVTDLVAGRPHPLERDRAGQFAVDLYRGYRLIFIATQQPPPTKADGSIDWAQVDDITIIEAGDYHG